MDSENTCNIDWDLFMKHFVVVLKEDVGVVDEGNLEEELESLFNDKKTIQPQLYEYAALALKRAYAAIPMKEGDRNMVKLVIELIPIYKQEATKKLSSFREMVINPNTNGIDYGRVKITNPLQRRQLTAMDTLRTLVPFMNLCTTLLPHVSVLHEDTLELELIAEHVFIGTKDFRASKRLLLFITGWGDQVKVPHLHQDMRNAIAEAMQQFGVLLNPANDRPVPSICSKNDNVLVVPQNFNIRCGLMFSTKMRVAVLIDSLSTCEGALGYGIKINPLIMHYGSELNNTVTYIDFGDL